MGPKRALDALPKALAEAKALLESGGKDVDAAGIEGLDRKVRVKAFSALSSTLKSKFPSKHSEYVDLSSDEERRSWLANFMLDPATGGSVGKNTVSIESASSQKTKKVWLTLDAYAGPLYLNNREHATLAVEDCPSRPHHLPKLAEKKVLEYEITLTWEEYLRSKKETAEVTTEAKLTAAEAEQVVESMRGPAAKKGRRQGPSGRRGGQPAAIADAELTPEDKATKASKASFEDQCKKTKQLGDKMQRELNDVQMVENKLKSKSWSATALEYLQKQTATQKDDAQRLFDELVSAKVKEFESNEKRDESTADLKVTMTTVEAGYQKYKREVLADFAKMV